MLSFTHTPRLRLPLFTHFRPCGLRKLERHLWVCLMVANRWFPCGFPLNEPKGYWVFFHPPPQKKKEETDSCPFKPTQTVLGDCLFHPRLQTKRRRATHFAPCWSAALRMLFVSFGAFCLEEDFNFLPTNGFSIHPLKVKKKKEELSAGSKPMVPYWGRCTTHFILFWWGLGCY